MISDRPIVFQSVRLFDGSGRPPLTDSTVIVQSSRITYAGPDAGAPRPGSGAEIIDARGQTLMPGLIDCHQHLDRIASVGTADQAMRYSLELNAIHAAVHARIVLEAGFTTVRDTGCRGVVAMAVRDAVATGMISGPRVLAAGQIISTTAGLTDLYPSWVSLSTGMGLIADGVDGLTKAARMNIKNGADFLKVEASGAQPGFLPPRLPTMTAEEMTAVVREARKRGKRVAAHAEHIDAVKNALKGGVDTIEHGEHLDDEAIEGLLSTGTTLVSTLANLDRLRISLEDPEERSRLGPSLAEQTHQRFETWRASFEKAYRAGVRIALGSDTANRNPHGRNAVELEHLVRYGMRTADALIAGTRHAAIACGLDQEVGTIEPGKLADILLVGGDPLADVTLLQRPEALTVIMKSGVIVQRRRG